MQPQMVKCPVCNKIGYTDERHQLNGEWPCAKHYIQMTTEVVITVE